MCVRGTSLLSKSQRVYPLIVDQILYTNVFLFVCDKKIRIHLCIRGTSFLSKSQRVYPLIVDQTLYTNVFLLFYNKKLTYLGYIEIICKLYIDHS